MRTPGATGARSAPATGSRRIPRGLTLVELLTVVAILAILAGVAGIPASADEGGSALDLAAIQLRDAFGVAQTLAYSMRQPHGVVFDPGNDRFAVVAADGSPARDPLTHGDYIIDFTSPGQPRGLAIVSADFGVTGAAGIFDAQGAPVDAGTVVVAKGDEELTLALDAATGKLEIP